jgi:hypothetical protein
MTQVSNIVIETATGTGTGNLTLAELPFYRRFSAAFGTGSGNQFYYCVRHRSANEYEVGIGYCSDANTLVRDSIIESSNSNNAVNFTAGDKDCINDVPASLQLGGASWGGITGTLSAQTDLQAALDGKLNITVGTTAPVSPAVGDVWIDTSP